MQTLNDFQKLLGDINWKRPFLQLSTSDLKPLFEILQGDPDPTSKRELTVEASKALESVEKALNIPFLKRIVYNSPWDLIILHTSHTPIGCLWQNGPLEWIHLPVSNTAKKILVAYLDLVASLINKGRKRSQEMFGRDVANIVIPYTRDQFEILQNSNEEWQISLSNYRGQVLYHLPKNLLLQFICHHPVTCYFSKNLQFIPHIRCCLGFY